MADDSKTLTLKYVGERFAGGILPVGVLSDLPAFRDLLVAFAKEEWKSLNPGRKRVPKGFDDSLALSLTSIEEGSALPQLKWEEPDPQSELPGMTTEIGSILETAHQRVIELIGGGQVDNLSSEKIRALNRFGAGLQPDEKIEIQSRRDRTNIVVLDTYRRKQLITGARDTYQTQFSGIGTLFGTNLDGSIRVDTQRYGTIDLPIEQEQIKEEFDGNLSESVQFDIIVELDHNDVFRRVVSVHDVGLIEAREADDIAVFNERISSLMDTPSKKDRLQKAARNALSLLDNRSALRKIIKLYPLPESGFQFEFEIHGWDYTVEFHEDGSLEFYGIEIDGPEELAPVQFDNLDTRFYVQLDKRVPLD